jgi:hypothetical protein
MNLKNMYEDEIGDNLPWWGYIHVNGSIQVKRYFSHLDLQEASESPFVERVYGHFHAGSREEAIHHIKKLEDERKESM